MTTEVTRPRAEGYGVSLDDDWFRLANSPDAKLTIYTRDSLAERQEDGTNPDENVLEIGMAFSRGNLTGGEGLDQYPRPVGEPRSEKDATRFWDSAGLDMTRPQQGLPHSIRLAEPHAQFVAGGSRLDLGASASSWYSISGTTVSRYADFLDSTADETDNLGENIIQIAVAYDDSVAVLATSGDIFYKGANATQYLKVYDSPADGDPAQAIWLVKGRIIAACRDTTTAKAGAMKEIAPIIEGPPGAPTEGATVISVVDTYQAVMNDCIDAGHAIVASFSDGSLRTYVPQSDTAGSTPDLTIRARMQMPLGENPYALAWNLGTLIIFTVDNDSDHVRLYLGSVLDVRFDYAVGQLQLVRTWVGATASVPDYTHASAATRDELFFFIEEATNESSLWRMDLTTNGLFRHNPVEGNGCTALFAFDDRLAWLDSSGITTTVEGEYQASGYVISPNVNFGLNTPINWLSWIIEAVGLDASGTAVELYRSSDPEAILDPAHGSWILVERLTDNAQSGYERTLLNVTSNTQSLMLVLYASEDGESSPAVQRFAVRGLPGHRDWIMDIPVNISDVVEVPGRQPYRLPGLGDRNYEALLLKLGQTVDAVALEPLTHIWGVVDAVSIPIDYQPDRFSVGRLAMVRVLGSRIVADSGTNPVGNLGWGIGTMGVMLMGVGSE